MGGLEIVIQGVRSEYNNTLHTSIMCSKIKLKCVLLKSGHGGIPVVQY